MRSSSYEIVSRSYEKRSRSNEIPSQSYEMRSRSYEIISRHYDVVKIYSVARTGFRKQQFILPKYTILLYESIF